MNQVKLLWNIDSFLGILVLKSLPMVYLFQRTMQWTLLLNFVLIDPMFSEKNIKNRPYPFWHRWAYCFFCVILINSQQILFREPSNEHSYQLLFQLSQWFRILKIMDADNKGCKVLAIPHNTLCVRWAKNSSVQYI